MDSEVEDTESEVGATILVSACLLGIACRFDGGSVPHPAVLQLARVGHVVPVCPEQLAGLPTPRPRHERRALRIVSEQGHDCTEQFERGAEQAVVIATLTGCSHAIVKARSPSCGAGMIYDGSFSGRLVTGDGVLTERLRAAGISVSTEEELAQG